MDTPVALYLQDAHPIREGMEIAKYAEAKGFARGVAGGEPPRARGHGADGGVRRVTDTIKVGSGVVDCWSRNPARLAATFCTLDDLAPGRVILGIGAWWDPLAQKVGIDRARPLTVMREIVTVVRALLHNETVTFDGAYVHLDGVELDYVYQERRPKDVPIYIGATGHADDGAHRRDRRRRGAQLPRLAGLQRAGDGGARRAVRPRPDVRLDDIDRPQLVVCSVHEDRQTALDMARLMVTQYLGQQPHIMKASGVPQSLLDEVGEVLTWPATHEQVEAASKLVPDEIVQMLTACGTPAEARAKVQEYIAHGCTCPILYPLGDVKAMIDAFA